MTFETAILPPTDENVAKATNALGWVHIDSSCRGRGDRGFKRLHRLKDGRFFVLKYLGHWRQFVVGVKVLATDGEPGNHGTVILGPTEIRREG